MFDKKLHSIESAKLGIKFLKFDSKKRRRGFLNSESINYGISSRRGFGMDGPNFTIAVLYGLFVFTIVLIYKSSVEWRNILPIMLILALAYTAFLIMSVLLVIALMKIIFDLFDHLLDNVANEGMFLHKNSVFCLYVYKHFFKS